MKSVSGIYIIVNKINSKVYIGYSDNISRRIRGHKSKLRKGIHHNIHLQNAVNQYNIENFEFGVLEEYPENLLCAMEHYWCNMLSSHNPKYGYNIAPTHPEKENQGCSESTRKLMSEKKRGLKYSEEHKSLIATKLREHRRLNGKTKLDVEQVKEIKILLKNPYKRVKNIANIFNVKPETISSIKNGKNWKDIII